MIYLIIFLVLILIISVISNKNTNGYFESGICPYKLTYNDKEYVSKDKVYSCSTPTNPNKRIYSLWRNGQIDKIFNSYKDYLKDFNQNQINYLNKNIECTPLVPTLDDEKSSILDIRNIKTRSFNLE